MNKHGIKAAATLTGLSDHVIRVWEKRYAAVVPERTQTNRRLYSDADISRLQTLSKLVKKGYAISQIAEVPDPELHALMDSLSATNDSPFDQETTGQIHQFIQSTATAIRNYDQAALEKTFDAAALNLGYSGLLENVIIPVIQQVGEDWHNGLITSASEHASTSFIKDYLSNSVRSFTLDESAPVLVVTTPAGQLHDLGAFIGACQARKSGWKVIYLGASLPADEIAGAIARVNATALLLGIVYPLDDPNLPNELVQLRKQVPQELPILVGGHALSTYSQTLAKINATIIPSFSGLSPELLKIRESRLSSPHDLGLADGSPPIKISS